MLNQWLKYWFTNVLFFALIYAGFVVGYDWGRYILFMILALSFFAGSLMWVGAFIDEEKQRELEKEFSKTISYEYNKLDFWVTLLQGASLAYFGHWLLGFFHLVLTWMPLAIIKQNLNK